MKAGWWVLIAIAMAVILFRNGLMDNTSNNDALLGGDGSQPDSGAGAVPTTSDWLDAWANAIKNFEGWVVGSRSYRNNNPGNIKGTGDAGTDADGFAVFSSPDAGLAALKSDLAAKQRKYPSFSILQIMTRYLGGDPNNPQVTKEGNPFTYAAAVANAIGVDIATTLGSL